MFMSCPVVLRESTYKKIRQDLVFLKKPSPLLNCPPFSEACGKKKWHVMWMIWKNGKKMTSRMLPTQKLELVLKVFINAKLKVYFI